MNVYDLQYVIVEHGIISTMKVESQSFIETVKRMLGTNVMAMVRPPNQNQAKDQL